MNFNPSYMENTYNGIIQIDVRNKLFADRKIMIFDDIDNVVAENVITQLMVLESISKDDITVYINSNGGIVSEGLAIYDTIKGLKCDVSTVCRGKAYSMAAILLAAGTKGKRYVSQNSNIMIHQVLSNIPFGQATDIQIRTRNIIETKENLNRILAFQTGQDYEKISADAERDCYFNAQQAVEYGIADEVI